MLCQILDEPARANELFLKCIEGVRTLSELEPGNIKFACFLVLAAARADRLAAESSNLQQLLDFQSDEPALKYRVACSLSQVYASLQRQPGQLSDVDPQAARSRAIQLIEEAISKGFDSPADLALDPDLKPIGEEVRELTRNAVHQ